MYTIQNFETLLGTAGFSDQLLKNHFALYEGYVKNTNTLYDKLESLKSGGALSTPEYAEMKRRFGWEYNGMRLHELYFGNLKKGGVALDEESALARAFVAGFGGYNEWLADFKATGAMRGIGWVVLVSDHTDKLLNIWINEHDVGLLAGAQPLLVMDVFEHSFMIDYGLKRADYIEAFLKAVDWEVVSKRF